MERQPYPNDLTDGEWELVKPLVPPAKPGGRPRTVNLRAVLNGINDVLKTGCQWDQVPPDFPPKGTVYPYVNTWRQDGTYTGEFVERAQVLGIEVEITTRLSDVPGYR